MDELIAFGMEVKALGDGRVGGVLVRRTNKNEPDLTGDFFGAESDIRSPETLDVYYNHGLDSTLKKRIIGKAKISRLDNGDVWAESQLNMRDEYEKAIYAMVEAGKMGYSSGALSHLVEREPAGKGVWMIKTWVIGEASLTPTPAEFRNTVVTLKSLIPPDAALPDTDEPTNSKTNSEVNKMDDNEIKALVAQGIADGLKAKADADEAIANQKAKEEEIATKAYKQALEDVKSNKAVAYHSTEPVDDDNDGMKAFKSWMQTGEKNGGLISPDSSFDKIGDAKAAWNVTTGASGGYLVPDPLYNQIIAKRENASWVRQVPTQKFTTESDHLLVPREDTSHTAFVLTAEAASYNEDEGTVSQKDLILYKYTKLIKANEEFLMYNSTNWESWLAEALGRAVAKTENTMYTSGTGTGQPEGVVTGATVANTTATTDVILPAEQSALFGYLGNGYNVAGETALLMANVTKWYLAGLTGNPFLFQQTPANSPDNIMGQPVVIDDVLEPYTTASAKCEVFGNFNFYAVVEKPGMIVQRNPYLYMATGQIGIFAKIFRGGGVLQSEAFYYLTNHS